MRKNVLALSAAAMVGGLGFGGVALAEVIQGTSFTTTGEPVATATRFSGTNATTLEINEIGRGGHHLIVPYYTVQNGQSTAFHITNTDGVNGKAVKVRFRGAGNSDDVLDFQVFLSPGDVWAAGLEQDPDTGKMRIFTVDDSCTIPRFGAVPNSFGDKVNGQVGYLLSNDQNTGTGGPAATREGYIEIFNMADLIMGSPQASSQNNATVSQTIKHTVGGAPACNPAVLELLASPSLLNDEERLRALGFDTPSTGLTSDWYILDLNKNTTFSGASLAIEARVGVGGPPGRGNFVVFPQIASAYGGDANERTADPLLRSENVGVSKNSVTGVTAGAVTSNGGSVVPSMEFDFPDMSTPYTRSALSGGVIDAISPLRQAAQLSHAMRASSIVNQYVLGADFGTDWVFSMPTRRYSVAMDYSASAGNPNGRRVFTEGIMSDGRALSTDLPVNARARPLFHDVNARFQMRDVTNYTERQPRICIETRDISFTNREEAQTRTIQVPSPGTAGVFALCGETTILQMNQNDGVLGGVLSSQVSTPPYSEGWGTIAVAGSNANNVENFLPIVGYAAIRARNSATNQNFGYTWPHRYNR